MRKKYIIIIALTLVWIVSLAGVWKLASIKYSKLSDESITESSLVTDKILSGELDEAYSQATDEYKKEVPIETFKNNFTFASAEKYKLDSLNNAYVSKYDFLNNFSIVNNEKKESKSLTIIMVKGSKGWQYSNIILN